MIHRISAGVPWSQLHNSSFRSNNSCCFPPMPEGNVQRLKQDMNLMCGYWKSVISCSGFQVSGCGPRSARHAR